MSFTIHDDGIIDCDWCFSHGGTFKPFHTVGCPYLTTFGPLNKIAYVSTHNAVCHIYVKNVNVDGRAALSMLGLTYKDGTIPSYYGDVNPLEIWTIQTDEPKEFDITNADAVAAYEKIQFRLLFSWAL